MDVSPLPPLLWASSPNSSVPNSRGPMTLRDSAWPQNLVHGSSISQLCILFTAEIYYQLPYISVILQEQKLVIHDPFKCPQLLQLILRDSTCPRITTSDSNILLTSDQPSSDQSFLRYPIKQHSTLPNKAFPYLVCLLIKLLLSLEFNILIFLKRW